MSYYYNPVNLFRSIEINTFFYNKLVFFKGTTSSVNLADLLKDPDANDQGEGADNKRSPHINKIQEGLKKKLEGLNIPGVRKNELKPVITETSDLKALMNLEKMIEKAKQYQDTIMNSNLFTREQVVDILDWVTSKDNIKNLDQNFDMLVNQMLPEEKRRMSLGMYWYNFDASITMKYHDRVQKEKMTDKRQILCEEVEKNLKDKYGKILSEGLDLNSDGDKKKYAKMMEKFEASFDSKNKDFESRNKALKKAKDFLIDVREKKSPIYKKWYEKEKKNWEKKDGGRLWVIFEAMQLNDPWSVAESEKMLEQAKEKYTKELRSRYVQLLAKVFTKKEDQESWIKNFEDGSLETKVQMYETLAKDYGKLGATEKKWMYRLNQVQTKNPKAFQEFNKRYEEQKMKKPREQILNEVEKDYEDLSSKYSKLLDKCDLKKDEREEMMKKFNNLETFDDMKKKVTESEAMVIKEALEGKEKQEGGQGSVVSGQKEKDKNEKKEELPQGFEQRALAKISELSRSSHSFKKMMLFKMAANKALRSQQYHRNIYTERNIAQDSKEMVNARIGGVQNQLQESKDYEQKEEIIESYMEEDCKNYNVEDINDHWGSFMGEDANGKQELKSLAAMIGGEDIFDFDKKSEKYGSNRYRFLNKDGSPCDLEKNWDKVVGARERQQNEEIALSVLHSMGLHNLNDDILKKSTEMIAKISDSYIKENEIDLLKSIADEDIMEEAKAIE